MILEGLALLLGATLLSGGNSKEKEEKKRLEKLERTRETRKKYYEDNNLNEQYKNIKRKIDNLLEEKEKYKELKFYINDFKVKKYTSKVENLRKEFIVFDDYFDIIEDYKEYFENLNSLLLSEEEVKNLNKEYVKKELNENKEFFSNIDGKSLDEQQRRAIVIDEDNNLVVAGAGSGKTLTISGKVKYLVEKKNIDPKDILLITFTKNATNEMTERINTKLGIPIEASTFHSLGSKISGYLKDEKYKVLENPYEILNNKTIKNILSNNPETMDALLEYSSYYIKDNETVLDEKFESKSDYLYTLDNLYTLREKTIYNLYESILKFKALYYKKFNTTENFSKEYCIALLKKLPNTEIITDLFENLENKYFIFKESDLEDIKYFLEIMKDEYKKPKDFFEYLFFNEKFKPYSGDKVKSQEERTIANFLFLNGIKFEYEKLYKNGKYYMPKDSYKTARGYLPDFYLPEYDIYIEHFGVDKDMKAHQYTESENQKYEKSMTWKRETHKINGTDLIETYSFYHQEGILSKKLEEELKKRGVKFKPLSKEEKELLLMINNNDEEFSAFCKLINTFLTLFKANNFNKEELVKFKREASEKNLYMRQKHLLFFKIFEPLYDYYNKKLKENNLIDFNDMINKAIDNLNNNSIEVIKKNNLDYKYIIIDEFQDTSISRFQLIKAIKNKIEECKILAVGDDWQSIYRFAGSDISIFSEFEKYFGKTEINFIEKTYRNPQELIDIAQNFIMKNENQLKKNLKSDKSLTKPVEFRSVNQKNKIEVIFDILKNIAKENVNKKKEVLILARNNYSFSQLNGKYFHVKDKKIKIEASNFINDKELKKLKYLKNIKLSIKTVHASKGLEADEVIIIDVDDDITGFPNKITDDSVLGYVLSKADTFLFGEERRLFYVALTRTKNRCFILFDEKRPSCFVVESYNTKSEDLLAQKNKRICKKCGSYMTKRKNLKTNEEFYGCSHYPKCSYTESL